MGWSTWGPHCSGHGENTSRGIPSEIQRRASGEPQARSAHGLLESGRMNRDGTVITILCDPGLKY